MDTKKRLLEPLGVRPGAGMDIRAIRSFAKSDPAGFAPFVQDLIDSGDVRLSKLSNLRGLYDALKDVEVPIVVEGNRAVTTQAFPLLVGNTVVAAINEAYMAVDTVGQELVTEMDDPKAVTVIARIASDEKKQDRVDEGDDFPEVSVSEDSVTIGSNRNGRKLSITAEAIEQNDIANIVERVNFLGDFAAKFVEKQTLKRVIDLDGSGTTPAAPYVYKPNGSGTSLFSSTANTPGARAPSGTRYESNALADETDLANALTRLQAMRDDNGNPIAINPNELIALVARSQESVAFTIKNSELIPGTTYSNAVNTWGPKGQYAGWRPISTGYLDLWNPSGGSHWYFGAPKRQFKRKWSLRMEYVTLGQSTQAYLNSRVAFQARIAWNCEIGATDYVYWVQCLNSTTAPSA